MYAIFYCFLLGANIYNRKKPYEYLAQGRIGEIEGEKILIVCIFIYSGILDINIYT